MNHDITIGQLAALIKERYGVTITRQFILAKINAGLIPAKDISTTAHERRQLCIPAESVEDVVAFFQPRRFVQETLFPEQSGGV
jgi:hypothetical protein